jgi:hypothetical protein
VASELEKQEFSYVLSKKAYHSVSEGHLWFSIFSRPPSNQFTRVQRCTCCFVLLFTAMLLNILYYNQSAEAKTNEASGGLSLGPLYITVEQVSLDVSSSFESFGYLDRNRCHGRIAFTSSESTACSTVSTYPIPTISTAADFNVSRISSLIKKSFYFFRFCSQSGARSANKKPSQRTFPWWCLFLAYGLSLALVGVSILFIIARGIEFGDLETQKWLTSILTSFFSSIFLTQPIKVR